MIKRNNMKSFLSLMIALLFFFSTISLASGLNIVQDNPTITTDQFESQDHANGISDSFASENPDAKYSEDTNVGEFLGDNAQEYTKKWDPWLTKAGINAIATTDDGDMMALASGYLYDDQIHLYRWNYQTDQYDLVWEVGGGVFKSDVTSLAFADTDYNNLTEIIAGSEDGYVYVFEQRHLYDPYTNMENQFDLVWKSPRLGRVFSLLVDDTDMDFRQDIIVGTGDTVRWFEYDTHGSYPFGEDHFIEYKEVFSAKMPSQITSLAVTDLEYNGLKEVAVGMRSGEIQLLENNGTTLMINGYPYPIAQDNSYESIWSNGNLIQRDISDMSGADLDNDGQVELIIAVQGSGAYVLDEFDGEIAHYRLQRPFESWEANPTEIYPLDYYADAMLNSSSIENGKLSSNPNVWYDNSTVGMVYGEPLNYTGVNYDVYPYSSASVMKPDGKVTYFDATVKDAWAIYDMGNDEEGAGNGVPGKWDINIATTSAGSMSLSVYISVDGTEWFEINSTYIESDATGYYVDVDNTLAEMSSLFYRYLKLNLTSGSMAVDYIYTPYINNPIYDALSTEAGPLTFEGDSVATTVGFIATIDGAILAAGWNATTGAYEIMWDSWTEERYKLGTNIFDLQMVKQKTRFPAWMDYGDQTFTLTLDSTTLPDGGKVMSYTAENFFNYRNEREVEFIVSSSKGNMFVYRQDSPYSKPYYDADLTTMLFGISDSITLGNFMSAKRSQGVKYFTASLVPVETRFASEFTIDGINVNADRYVDPVLNGYWLFVGSWDGYVAAYDSGSISVTPYINDISVWYFTQAPSGYSGLPAACTTYSFSECGYFSPLLNSTTGIQSLTNMEVSGMMDGVFRESSWMPKVSSADFVGSKYADLIMTNGKVHLLETVLSQNEERVTLEDWVNPSLEFRNYLGLDQVQYESPTATLKYTPINTALTEEFSQYNFVYKSDYFKEINEDSKGRKWTNANPVDFDNDGDFDLVLGFARYEQGMFGISKKTFGITYWENQGTAEEPKWVEQKKAMNNNQIGSNFQNEMWTEPVLSFNNYIFPKGVTFDPKLGYHPLYKANLPDTLFMFQANSLDDLYQGRLRAFYADYNARTSLLAATYPEARRLDINLFNNGKTGLEKKVNYGYHIFETWSNEKELDGWTLSMASADLDGDGKNEMVVGDFNNNVYVFEHLTNNTFKRAYKSFDLNRTILTDDSPYANEKFGGISGTFYRTIFEHARMLIAGFDLNGNGQQEFIVSTGSMVYVFESVRTSVNRIRDDSYQLIGIIDLYDEKALTQMPSDGIEITSMTWADDLTRDGRKELILGVNNALLIFEISSSPYTFDYSMKQVDPFMSPYFMREEIFFGDTFDILGKFDVPGNFILNPDYVIKSIIVDDFDRDGRLDLIYAGTDTSNARDLWSGFVAGLEWDGSTFVSGFDPEVFADTVLYNPINDLAVMDADYDDKFELVIGHTYGVDIYEFSDVDTVELRDVITSSPSYMLPRRSYFTPPIGADGQLNIVSRFKDVIRLDTRPAAEGFVGKNNTILMGYGSYRGYGQLTTNSYNAISFASSSDDGDTWKHLPSLDISLVQMDVIFFSVDKISMTESPDGTIWLSVVLRTHNDVTSTAYSQFFIWRLVPKSTTWTLVTSSSLTSSTFSINEPTSVLLTIASLPDRSDAVTSVITWGNRSIIANYMISVTNGFVFTGIYNWGYGNVTNPGNFTVYDLDLESLGVGDDGLDRYGLVFSGFVNAERLSLDTDIWYADGYLNTSTNSVVLGSPQRTFASGNGAFYPSIIKERDTGNLLITFEQQTLRAYGGLYAIWSNDDGRTWNGPYDMSHPLGIDSPLFKEFPSPSGETYRVGTITGDIILQGFKPLSPVVVPGMTRGFTMTYSIKVQVKAHLKYSLCGLGDKQLAQSTKAVRDSFQACGLELNWIANAYNPWSNWSWYKVGEVTDLAVGDSDKDFRQEILVASGKNAHLFEFATNSRDTIRYTQKWTSPDYERDIVSVAISDANSNGAPELFIESERGVVHSYEVVNLNPATTPLLKPATGLVSPTDPDTFITGIDLYDVTGDGVDDIIALGETGNVTAFDGTDLSVLWKFIDNEQVTSGFNSISIPSYLVESGGSMYYQYTANSTIYNLDLVTGLEIASYSIGETVIRSIADDLDGDGLMETIIVTLSGRILILDADSLVLESEYSLHPSTYEYSDVRVGNFIESNLTSIALFGTDGNITVMNPSDGSILWNTIANITIDGFRDYTMNLGDFDSDGTTDIFVSSGTSTMFAYSPSKASQIWNRTDFEYLYRDYGYANDIGDVNGDNVTDIIIPMSGYQTPIFVVLDGRTGNEIYSTELRIAGGYTFVGGIRQYTFDMNGIDTDVFSIALGAFSLAGDFVGYSMIVDRATGIPFASVNNEYSFYAAAGNEGGIPTIYSGNFIGNVYKTQFFEGVPEPEKPVDVDNKLNPFIRLGDEFTSRTDYLLHDAFNEAAPGLDGIDDIFVVDDYFVGGADTFLLENDKSYNDAVWTYNNIDIGKYQGGAFIADLESDGKYELIAPFQNILLVFNVQTGDVIGKWNYLPGDFKSWYNFNAEVVDWNDDGRLDIVYSRGVLVGGVRYTEFGWFKNGDVNSGPTSFTRAKDFFRNQFLIADIDGDFLPEMVTYSLSRFNKYIGNFTILSGPGMNNFYSPSFLAPNDGLIPFFPITNMLTDSTESTLYLSLDYSLYNVPSLPFDLSTFPTLILGFEWTGSGFAYAATDAIGISPLPGFTRDLYNVDAGTREYLLGVGKRGDLYSMEIGGTSLLLNNLGVFDTLAVPYTKDILVFGNFCDDVSYYMITSATSVGCYNTFNFTSSVNALSSFDLDFDIIQDIVKGDLDGDGIDDVIVASRSGYVWIVSSEENAAGLELLTEEAIQDISTPVVTQQVDVVSQWVYVVLASVLSMGVMVIRKKQ